MDSERSVETAVAALARGGMVVVADDHDRENEGDLVMSAAAMTDRAMAFFLRHGSGIVCTPMTARRARELDLPLMVAANKDRMGTAFTVTVDAVDAGTGISAADRATTARALAHPGTAPSGLTRPGHMFPLIAQDGGVLVRRGHTEASVDLVSLAGEAEPTAVITELVGDDGVPMSGPTLTEFAAAWDLPYVTVADLAAYRRRHGAPVASVPDVTVAPVSSAHIDTDFGTFTAHVFRDRASGVEHVALALGLETPLATAVTVRVHSECLTGDAFGSRRCDCGPQLQDGLRAVAAAGAGVLVYLRGHEGRGIGIANKLAAYALQEQGADTVDANIGLGLPVDAREYDFAAEILRYFGIESVDLITNNPEKVEALERFGIEVRRRVGAPVHWGAHNVHYLQTKRERMGHILPETPHQFLHYSSV
ncbi:MULTISPECIES: GTP cyclohydrolase II [Rhodococcus]|jgi:3,4-dihydroxy 2-butanone 4-phosphate synthase/GTP cyclohydrolase II|uniref:GTP cyclohydrolase II n=1 Tax=Rhodococcus TaxID=1827 RepID=UPI00141E8D2B|nr:GTP cyclohydrolase II [Rhodococcus opacus]NHU47044.1 GTP cyclohydrolase II [Rhodococcus sp. A14]UZG59698.1 GTP cyclohydrolase II [Rhodococcus opacus]